MGFLVDRGGGLPPIRRHEAPEEKKDQVPVDAVTAAAPRAQENKPTIFSNGRWMLIAAGVLPWVGLGALKLFMLEGKFQ